MCSQEPTVCWVTGGTTEQHNDPDKWAAKPLMHTALWVEWSPAGQDANLRDDHQNVWSGVGG